MLAFDIELASLVELPPGGDLDSLGPFDLAVVAAVDERGAERLWHGGAPGSPSACMDPADARAVLEHLRARQQEGEQVVAWNGVGFDLKWLGHAAGDLALAGAVALECFDPMLQFFHRRGFPVALAAVAEGFRLELRKSMSGAEAPQAWARGEFQRVIDYVRGDCQLTLQVARRIVETRSVRWVPKRGGISSEPLPRLLTARELLREPEPDQSWMDRPLPRQRFFDWIPPELLER